MNARFTYLIAGLLLFAGLAGAADWPQWRGPNRDGHSPETGLLKSFPSGGPKLLWTFEKAGLGYSAPAVVGAKVYGMGDEGRDEFVFALDASGKQLWRTPVGSNFPHNNGGGPRCTPTMDGDALYVLGADGDLCCLATADGKLRWKVNLERDLRGVMMSDWGYSESPLVDGDQVVCSPGGDGGVLAAFDKKSGKVIWRSTGLSAKATYSSIVVSNAGGVRHYVQMTGDGVAGFSPRDGKVLWEQFVNDQYTVAVVPTPIIAGDDVYVTSSYGAGCARIHLAADGRGGLTPTLAYQQCAIENHLGGVIRVGDHVFGTSGNINNKRSLPMTCQELKTGKIAWQHDLEPSSVAFADGCLYCYGQATGTLVRVEASPKGYVEKGRFTIPRQTRLPKPNLSIWTHPVIADGKLFLRDHDLLFCYDLRARG